MPTTLWIAIGGAIGSVARYWITLLTASVSTGVPWGTIAINIAGSFAIAFFGTLTVEHGRHPLPETARLFFMVGICGGFTTFSSFSEQNLELLRAGMAGHAVANIAVSVLACITAAAAGFLLGEHFNGDVAKTTDEEIEEEA